MSTVTDSEHRDLMSNFPTGVGVVTTLDREGKPMGFTCTSLVSVTLRPPTLLICVCTGSLTLTAIQEHGAFGVNLLRSGSRRVAETFASAVPDRFADVAWQLRPATRTPWLTDDAVAYADCAFDAARGAIVGDHAVLIGTVRAVWLGAGRPLLYGMRQFGEWAHEAEEPITRHLQDGFWRDARLTGRR
jgi:flavin reductase (DIM6/NTAB) family NADH-FMN oxidoreductase RutF